MDTYPSVAHLVSVRRRNMLPAQHLATLKGTHGSGRPVTFLWRIVEAKKWFGDGSSFITGKASSVMFYALCHGGTNLTRLYDVSNFVINSSQNFLYDKFWPYSDESHLSWMH